MDERTDRTSSEPRIDPPPDRTGSASMDNSQERRLHSLDALRTVAAIAVVFGHWPPHFFAVKEFARPTNAAPFYSWLHAIYLHGPSAVHFFFCLSGFIFYWLYADAVFDNRISYKRFSALRISRLYPLHFATLVLLIPLVAIFRALFGFDFIYQYNDAYHLILNLTFIQWWGVESGYSWNGPSWSISIEIALYILFFIACRLARPGPVAAIVLTMAALVLARYSPIASAAVAFFAGGLTYYAIRASEPFRTPWVAVVAVIATLVLWIALWPLSKAQVAADVVASVGANVPSETAGSMTARAVEIFFDRVRELILFPSLIFLAAFLELSVPTLRWRALAGVGNISYGVYLLHFPLQLIAVSLAFAWSLPSDTFTRPATFVVFFAILLGAAAASYRWLERPAMRAMR